MGEFKKNATLLDGRGEKDIDWITVKGNHIPIKKGQTPGEAVKERLKDYKKVKTGKVKIGNIDTNLYNKILGKNLKNYNIVIPDTNIKHVFNRHGKVFENYKNELLKAINEPDYIFMGDVENRVLITKRFQNNLEIVLELSFDNSNYSNKIISIWELSDKDLNKMIKNKKILYKK